MPKDDDADRPLGFCLISQLVSRRFHTRRGESGIVHAYQTYVFKSVPTVVTPLQLWCEAAKTNREGESRYLKGICQQIH